MELLLNKIVNEPRAYFCYQEEAEGETPPISDDEKKRIVDELFQQNKTLFLQRYNSFMNVDDCSLFDKEDDFIVKHFLAQIRRREATPSTSSIKQEFVKDTPNKGQIRNRRFAALQKMKKEGRYFSNEKMREREPLLFDKMIGRYLDEKEQLNLRPTVSRAGGWSRIVEQFEESMEVADRRNEHSTIWDHGDDHTRHDEHQSRFFSHVANKLDDEFVPEEDEMEDQPQEENDGPLREIKEEVNRIHDDMMLEFDEDEDTNPEVLQEEFIAYMEDRFMAGKDENFFDYTIVDNNATIDDKDVIREQDLQDRWFDQEEAD
ncbi:unnamed protein product, partial [Mesorhabditis belari]|uniref:CCD97-like C-terminal domain-containing protein n=1 Tax=Mesorhabditis belari TaxID=2138241 RepID=A0AAF3ELB6_9BILA